MLRKKLYFILEDLKKHKRSRDDAMTSYVSERLNDGLVSYLHDTSKSVEFLTSRNGLNTLKKLNRE